MKCIPKYIIIAKRHIRQTYKGLCYTKLVFLIIEPVKISVPEANEQSTNATIKNNKDSFPQDHGYRTNEMFIKLFIAREFFYPDQMGRFPIISIKGNQ